MRTMLSAVAAMVALSTGSPALALGGGGPAAMTHNGEALRQAAPRPIAGERRPTRAARGAKARQPRAAR